MKKFLVILLALTLVFALSAAAMANAEDNQDFTGTLVTVAAPESVLVAEEATITITVENVADRGLPQVSVWVNGEQVEFYNEIGKGKSVEYTVPVDTSEAGLQAFEVVVWTRLGNQNWAQELYKGTKIVEVQQPKSEGEIAAELLGGLSDAEITAGLSLVDGVMKLTVGDNMFVLMADAKNLNQTGELDLGDGYWLVFDIAGNGSNIKSFSVEYRD